MKLNNILVLLLTLFCHTGYAQGFLWARSIADRYQPDTELANYSTLDNEGNIYTVGNLSGITDMDPGAGVHTLTPTSDADFFIQKLNSKGEFIWAKQITNLNPAATDWENKVTALEYDGKGNVCISGVFNGKIDLDPGPDTSYVEGYKMNSFVLKLTTAGDFVFGKQLIGTGSIVGISLAVSPQGNIYVGGIFDGVADMDPGAGVYNLTCVNSGWADGFVVKLTENGEFLKAIHLGSPDNDEVYEIKVNRVGEVYIKGSQGGGVDLDPGPGTFYLTDSEFFLKLDIAENFVWAKPIVGINFDLDSASCIYTTYLNGDVQKFDSGGNAIWTKKIEVQNGYIKANDIVTDASGNVYFTGIFTGAADFDPGVGVYKLITDTSSNFTDPPDIFILKLDSTGNFKWARQVGGKDWDEAVSIHADEIGNVYVTGLFRDTVDFDPDASIFSIGTSFSTVSDPFILKLSHKENSVNDVPGMNFNIVPNPTSFKLHISDIGNVTSMQITDMQGRLIKQFTKPEKDIDVSILPSGMYLLLLQTDEGVYTHKFVKE